MATQYTSPPATFTIHPILQYWQSVLLANHPTLLMWDMREERCSLFQHPIPPQTLYSTLHEHATVPPIPKLHIICGIIPEEYGWEMTASNADGVTILDVIKAIRGCLERQITREEWDNLSPKQQDRIFAVFDERWRGAAIPRMAHAHGVLRQDCLLHHTIFRGLSPSYLDATNFVLTLGKIEGTVASFGSSNTPVTRTNLVNV